MKRFKKSILVLFAILVILFPIQAQDEEKKKKSYWMDTYPGKDKKLNGVVIAAPHEGYEKNTGKIAKTLSKSLGSGCVIANNYRNLKNRVWINVNRPTQCYINLQGKKRRTKKTTLAKVIYRRYQKALVKAGNLKEKPLSLLIEIHGHNRRYLWSNGKWYKVNTIEVATTGVTKERVRKMRKYYNTLLNKANPSIVCPIFFDILKSDKVYVYREKKIAFMFYARGTKTMGAFRKICTKKGLHFELPLYIRKNKTLLKKYTKILKKLVFWFVDKELNIWKRK